MITRESGRWAALLCILLGALWGNLAQAQSTLWVPPVRPTVDANGVNLVNGQFQGSVTDISVGKPGAGGLTFTRFYGGVLDWSFSNEYLGNINVGDNGTTTTVWVTMGGSTETFTKADSPAGSPYVSGQGTVATLTQNANSFTYTAPDATVYVFSKSITSVGNVASSAWISSMTLPNGELRTFNYVSSTYCYPGCSQPVPITRLQSVTNNFGYQIKLLYQSDTTPVSTNEAQWLSLAGVMGVNMAVQYCDPLAVVCAQTTPPSWPSVSYVYGSGCDPGVTDLLGNVTCYTYAGAGGSSPALQLPGNSSVNILYTQGVSQGGPTGKIGQVTRNGQTWTYSYSFTGPNPTTTVTDPLNRTSTYEFDGTTNAITSYTNNAAGETTTYLNDSYGRPTTITFPSQRSRTYHYDTRGNIDESHLSAYPTGSPDLIWKANYDSTCSQPNKCNQPNWTLDPAGNETDYTYDPVSGMLASATLPAPTPGAVRPATTYTYTQYQAYYQNSSGAIVASGSNVSLLTSTATCRTTSGCTSSSTDQLRTDITYGSTGVANNLLPVTSTNRDGAGTLIATTTYGYDAVGNVVTVDGPLGSSVQRTAIKYDALRRVVGTATPDPDGSGPRLNIGVRTTYDARGFPTTVDTGTLPGQSDSAWQSFTVSQTVTKQFDAEGRATQSSVAAQGSTYSVQQTTYDTVGRVECHATRMNPSLFSSLPALACTLGTAGSFGPDRILEYSYDGADRLQSVVTGLGTSVQATKQQRFYYPGGLLHTLTDGNGYVTTYNYDSYGRLQYMYYPDPSTVGASSTTDYEQLSYDLDSNVTSVRRRSTDVIQTPRDSLGRMTEKLLPGDAAESVYYAYDNQGRLLSALYNNVAGNGITQNYDGLGRLYTHAAFGRQLTYGYDLASRRTQLTYPDGYYVTYGYTNVDELQSITDSTGTRLANYSYDPLGFRTVLTRPNSTDTTTYTPNAMEKLAQLTHSFSSSSFNMTSQFGYNPAGQVVSKAQNNDAAYTWTPSPSTQTISSPADNQNKLSSFQNTSLGYDPNANVASGINALTYTYDVLGQLRTATGAGVSASVAYDPSGMLWQESNGSTTTQYLYDGGDLVAEYVNGTITQRFVHGGAGDDEPLVWYQGPGTSTRYFLHADERGSIITASDGNAVATASVKYGSYGESGSLVSPFGYTGQLYMPDLQLYYYKARMYSPQTGRFLQPDPIGYEDNTNLYAYVDGDPVNLSDSSGLEWQSNCWFVPPTFSGDPQAVPDVTVNGTREPLYCNDTVAQATPGNSGGGGTGGSSQGPQKGPTLPPCMTFAEDFAARKAIAAQNEAAVAAAGSVNDLLGSTAEVTGSLSKALGKSAAGAEAFGKASAVLGIAFTANDAIAAIRTHDPQKTFDASYGGASLAASLIDPMIGVGMALASVVDKLAPPPPTAFGSEIANTGPKCRPQAQ